MNGITIGIIQEFRSLGLHQPPLFPHHCITKSTKMAALTENVISKKPDKKSKTCFLSFLFLFLFFVVVPFVAVFLLFVQIVGSRCHAVMTITVEASPAEETVATKV